MSRLPSRQTWTDLDHVKSLYTLSLRFYNILLSYFFHVSELTIPVLQENFWCRKMKANAKMEINWIGNMLKSKNWRDRRIVVFFWRNWIKTAYSFNITASVTMVTFYVWTWLWGFNSQLPLFHIGGHVHIELQDRHVDYMDLTSGV